MIILIKMSVKFNISNSNKIGEAELKIKINCIKPATKKIIVPIAKPFVQYNIENKSKSTVEMLWNKRRRHNAHVKILDICNNKAVVKHVTPNSMMMTGEVGVVRFNAPGINNKLTPIPPNSNEVKKLKLFSDE